LAVLDLSENDITCDGAEQLARALERAGGDSMPGAGGGSGGGAHQLPTAALLQARWGGWV
jgi:hypothetical protein